MKVQKSNRSCNSESQRTKKKFKQKSLKFCRQPMKQEICTMNWGNKTFRNSIFPKIPASLTECRRNRTFIFYFVFLDLRSSFLSLIPREFAPSRTRPSAYTLSPQNRLTASETLELNLNPLHVIKKTTFV